MTRTALASALAVLLLGIGVAAASAAPPPNDSFSAAAWLPVGGEISASNVEATAEAQEADTAGVAKAPECARLDAGAECASSVWFRLEPPVGGEYTIETCDLGTEVDSAIGVFTGADLGSAVEVAGNDDADDCPGGLGRNGSRVTFAATAGTVYRVAVGGMHADQGSFYLRAYPGEARPRPEPDTSIRREGSSFIQGLFRTGLRAGVVSGPRHSASFALFSGAPGASFECALDGAAFSPCASPVSLAGLAAGSSHVFAARAVDAGLVDPTPVIQRFTIDLEPPETSLVAGPPATTAAQALNWEVASSERNAGRYGFLCSIDGAVLDECSRSFGETSICRGTHSFQAAAIDAAGNVDPSPVSGRVEVTSGVACGAPTVGEPIARNVTPTSAEISADYFNEGPRGTVRIEYGTSAAYDMSLPPATALSIGSTTAIGVLRFLEPATVYHYRVTISTPAGTVSSPDRTLTTSPPTGTVPKIALGAPLVAPYTAVAPATIDPQGTEATGYELRIRKAGSSDGIGAAIGSAEIPAGAGPRQVRIEVVDLEPCTTYRYRVVAFHRGGDENEAASAEAELTTPPISGPGPGKAKPSLPVQALGKGKAKGLLRCGGGARREKR